MHLKDADTDYGLVRDTAQTRTEMIASKLQTYLICKARLAGSSLWLAELGFLRDFGRMLRTRHPVHPCQQKQLWTAHLLDFLEYFNLRDSVTIYCPLIS